MSRSKKKRAGRKRRQQEATEAPLPGPSDTQDAGGSTLMVGKRPVLAFFLVFGLLMGLFYVASITVFFEEFVWIPYLRLNANATASILSMLGQDIYLDDRTISTTGVSLVIERGCDAIYPSALYFTAVLAFPVSLRRKLPGAVVGVVALLLINLVRLVSLYFVAVYWSRAFEMMHLEVWQALFIFLAVLFWGTWAWWATRSRSVHADAAA
ncbi:MAG: archaeosortase/exosortase family protein [Planctomycetota bacterium]